MASKNGNTQTDTESEHEENNCSETKCKDDDDSMRIKCTGCKRSLHYVCTGLPAYQLQFFIKKKGYRKYTCINCSPVAQELSQKIHEQSRRITSCTYSSKEIKACENIIKANTENEKRLNNVVKELQSRCQKSNEQNKQLTNEIKSQFSELETKLMEKIERKVNENRIKTKPITTKKTFAQVAKENQQQPSLLHIKKALRDEKFEEKLEEQRKQEKQLNIIIHGVPESDDVNHDDTFLNELLDDTGNKTEQLFFDRIGPSTEGINQRPIKVVFCNAQEKDAFMRSLSKLKDIQKYARISITDDLTRTERQLIKFWKNKADQRNKVDKNKEYVWRVRGSPRGDRGLYLKKIPIS